MHVLTSCLLEDFPRKVSADRDFFAAIPSELGLFLDHLSAGGRLPQASALSAALGRIADEIPQAAADT